MTAQPSSQAEREDVAREVLVEQLHGFGELHRAILSGDDVTGDPMIGPVPVIAAMLAFSDREHATPRSMPEEVVEVIWKRACEGREGYCSSDLQDAARWAIGEAFRLAEQAARSVTLPNGYQWSDGNREKFDFGRDTAADAIRAIPGASA